MTRPVPTRFRPLGLTLALAASLPAQSPVTVPFLDRAPVLDGKLETTLAAAPPIALHLVGADGTLQPGPVRAHVAYGAEFLYVFVASPQAALQCRDRAYQNGDGLHLALGEPREDGQPTEQFRVLGFSPQVPEKRNWQYAFTWYRNKPVSLQPLSGARFAWSFEQGMAGFEALIPWSSLTPFHPWASPRLGLNLAYVEAVGSQETRTHMLVRDPKIGSENRPRILAGATFLPPTQPTPAAWTAALSRGHLVQGQTSELILTGALSTATPFRVTLHSGEGEATPGRTLTLPPPTAKGLGTVRQSLPPVPFPGGYTVDVEGPDGRTQRLGMTVLPEAPENLRKRVEALSTTVDAGTRATLAFRVQELLEGFSALHPRDTAARPRMELEQLERQLAATEVGRDPFAHATGTLRRAYRSAFDGSLQPYSLRVPANLDPGKRYPMVVSLHGSGQDDRAGIPPGNFPPEGWFVLAPKGRGISNCYSGDHAQVDLREALEDVLARYPVDPGRLVLAGFSMGGYGVYRTHVEDPKRFKALVVLSGVPDLATRWLGPGHPNFLESATLAPFKGIPMFIVHGTEDRNCPYAKTVQVVEGLKAAGARVTFVSEEGRGHEGPGLQTLGQLVEWLNRHITP